MEIPIRVLKAYHTSVPLIDGSVRTFVFPATFEAKHPDDYASFVAAYRATLAAAEFQKFLQDNRMRGNCVGEERTTQIIRANFEGLKKYKDLLKYERRRCRRETAVRSQRTTLQRQGDSYLSAA